MPACSGDGLVAAFQWHFVAVEAVVQKYGTEALKAQLGKIKRKELSEGAVSSAFFALLLFCSSFVLRFTAHSLERFSSSAFIWGVWCASEWRLMGRADFEKLSWQPVLNPGVAVDLSALHLFSLQRSGDSRAEPSLHRHCRE